MDKRKPMMFPDILHMNVNKVFLRHLLSHRDKMSHLGEPINYDINGVKPLGLGQLDDMI